MPREAVAADQSIDEVAVVASQAYVQRTAAGQHQGLECGIFQRQLVGIARRATGGDGVSVSGVGGRILDVDGGQPGGHGTNGQRLGRKHVVRSDAARAAADVQTLDGAVDQAGYIDRLQRAVAGKIGRARSS